MTATFDYPHADRVEPIADVFEQMIPGRPERDLADWLAKHPEFVERYQARVWRELGDDACWFWLGAINGDTGHAKQHVRYEHWTHDGREYSDEWMTYGHQIAWVLSGGQLDPDIVLRHTCDEASCQNMRHLAAGSRGDNLRDWYSRRFVWTGPLNDPRGPAGRAQAIRDAILDAGPGLEDQVAAIREVMDAGWRSLGQLTLLPEFEADRFLPG